MLGEVGDEDDEVVGDAVGDGELEEKIGEVVASRGEVAG